MFNIDLIRAILFLFIVGAVYLIEFYLIYKLIYLKDRKDFISKRAIVVHFLAVVGFVCFLYGFFVEPNLIEVKTDNIYTQKLDKVNLRVVHISDLHCEKRARNEKKMVEIINSLQPDIIVFTGDAINTEKGLNNFKENMGKLKASIGKYAVRGNWDLGSQSIFSDAGFKLVDNNSYRLFKEDEVFYISGENYGFGKKAKDVVKNIPSDCFSIFLYHTPDLIEDISGEKVDLYLAGHTHGGQVRLPFYGAMVTLSKYGKKYEMGDYIVNNTYLYVNRGLGMEGGFVPRVRFLAKPEIAVFDIKPIKE